MSCVGQGQHNVAIVATGEVSRTSCLSTAILIVMDGPVGYSIDCCCWFWCAVDSAEDTREEPARQHDQPTPARGQTDSQSAKSSHVAVLSDTRYTFYVLPTQQTVVRVQYGQQLHADIAQNRWQMPRLVYRPLLLSMSINIQGTAVRERANELELPLGTRDSNAQRNPADGGDDGTI